MAQPTSYTPEHLEEVIKLIKEAKNIVVKSQDFNIAASLRDIERMLSEKQEADKNRKI